MKKIRLLLFILIALVITGCGVTPTVSYATSSITIEVGDTYRIEESNINVVGASGYTLHYDIANRSIASISGDTIKGESIGITTLSILVRYGLSQVSTTVDVRVVPKIIRADSITISHSHISLNLQNEYTFNKITLSSSENKTVNEVPSITITPSIVEYDYITGKVTGLATGEATVTITYQNCSTSFTVEVYDHIYVNTLVLNDTVHSNTIKMFRGESGKLNYSLSPKNANTFSFTTESNLIKMSADGEFETLGVGSAKITLKYYTAKNNSITHEFYINVEDKVTSLDIDILSNPTLDTHGSLYNDTVDKNVAVLEKEYLLSITANTVIDIENVTISDNINLLSTWQRVGNVYTNTITFKNNDENTVSATYSKTVYNVENTVSAENYQAQVYSIYDIVVEVRYNLLNIGTSKTTYEIYRKPFFLDTFTSAMTYVDFVCYLDEEKMIPYNDNVTSYISSILVEDNIIDSNRYDLGTHTVQIHVLGYQVDYFTVKITSPNITLALEYDNNVTYSEGMTIEIVFIVNNLFDSNIYTIDNSHMIIKYDSKYNDYISVSNNQVIVNAYIPSITLDIYYEDSKISPITISISE